MHWNLRLTDSYLQPEVLLNYYILMHELIIQYTLKEENCAEIETGDFREHHH